MIHNPQISTSTSASSPPILTLPSLKNYPFPPFLATPDDVLYQIIHPSLAGWENPFGRFLLWSKKANLALSLDPVRTSHNFNDGVHVLRRYPHRDEQLLEELI